MKSIMYLADAVVIHPDSTITMVRGGICQISAKPGQPIIFRGAIWVSLFGETNEIQRMQRATLLCLDESRQSVGPPQLEFDIQIPAEHTYSQVAINVELALPKPGKYDITLNLGKTELWSKLEAKLEAN